MSSSRRRPPVWLLALLAVLLPIGLSAAHHAATYPGPDWGPSGRASAGLLPPPAAATGAVIRVYAARTVRWRGIFATHSWLVLKEAGAPAYDRFDYTAWGDPIRTNGFPPDGRWFGAKPVLVFAADGEAAARAIPRIRAAIASYAWRNRGDYRAWPGPNSNTFVASALAAAPELQALLPPTAIGRDFPHDGRWIAPATGGLGFRVSLGGYLGLAMGWHEGVEVSLFGAVIGVDLRRPAIKLPGIGRVGVGEDFV